MPLYLIHTPQLENAQQLEIETVLGAPLYAKKNHYQCDAAHKISKERLNALRQQLKLDINLLPETYQPEAIRLVISDMDSTLIAIECVDEIADMLNIKAQVSAITEAAMRGELDFSASLKKRVALLKGLEVQALEKVYQERLCLNPGAEQWLQGLKAKNIAFALVSGGFTYFTDRLKAEYGLDFTRANILEELEDKLTGTVDSDIIDAQAKADYLHELCQQLKITPDQVIAIGDGANDLLMMQEAGLSIAYHAKPTVQAQADTAINFRGLDACLDFLEI
ncbi:phosphoserine phosphatase SerB [Galenea microaerophila]